MQFTTSFLIPILSALYAQVTLGAPTGSSTAAPPQAWNNMVIDMNFLNSIPQAHSDIGVTVEIKDNHISPAHRYNYLWVKPDANAPASNTIIPQNAADYTQFQFEILNCPSTSGCAMTMNFIFQDKANLGICTVSFGVGSPTNALDSVIFTNASPELQGNDLCKRIYRQGDFYNGNGHQTWTTLKTRQNHNSP
eukprot:Awhi_evm1s11927